MTWNELTGLDEEFMREHRIENPPSWLLPFIQNGMVLRAAIGHVATPKPLQGRQTLRFSLRTRDDYDFMARLVRAHGWLPKSRIVLSNNDNGGSVSCMHRDDRELWASCRFYPLED